MPARTKKFNGLVYRAESSWKRKTDAIAHKARLKSNRPSISLRMTVEPRRGGGASYKIWTRG
jgi:hypothetical protein